MEQKITNEESTEPIFNKGILQSITKNEAICEDIESKQI